MRKKRAERLTAEAMRSHQGLVANPNCVAAILTVAIAPLRSLAPIREAVVATYQSASGAGARAMEDLEIQTRDHLEGRPVIPRVLPHPYAFNLFSHDSAVEDNGYNGEENKVMAETRKILGVHIIGTGATELIHIGQAVFGLGGTVDYFVDTVFNYPTFAECYKVAGLDGFNKVGPPE